MRKLAAAGFLVRRPAPEQLREYEVNTIGNHDPDVIPFLDLPPGTRLGRSALGDFQSEM